VSVNEVPAEVPVTATRRELAVARGIDQARSRAQNRVELFLDAARELMNTNATDFTVQEVVERSGQSLRTFYQYFGGKHELMLALFEESIQVAADHLEELLAPVDDPRERLRVFSIDYLRMCRTSRPGEPPSGPAPALVEFAQQLLTSHPKEAARAFTPVRELLGRLLAEAEAAGVLRPGLDLQRITGVVLQAVMFNAFAASISASPPDEGEDVLWDLLLRGIAAGE
jgi:AcrR family transcriptional regulator